MNQDLMESLRTAIAKYTKDQTRREFEQTYSPKKHSLKKYKGNLVIFNEETQEYNYF